MRNKVVNLSIRLRDNVSSGLGRISRGLRTVRAGLGRVGAAMRKMAFAGLAATTAVVGGLVALAKAYSDQESAENKLKATFDAAGESGAKAVKKWGAFATAIQRVTTAGDEEILNLIALMKTMGVANNRMEEATKGALGLSKAFGIDLNSAAKMVALAMQGEYTMLQRYIPALRTANTEAEKAAIVQRAMAHGFQVAQAELNTVKGQWAALKGVFGDVMQAAGKVLFGNDGLVGGIRRLKEHLIDLEEDGVIARWAEQAKAAFQSVVDTIRIITRGGEGRAKVMQAMGGVIVSAFTDAANAVLSMFARAFPALGSAIGSAAWDAWKNRGQDSATSAQMTQAREIASEAKGTPFYKEVLEATIDSFEKANRDKRLEKAGVQLGRQFSSMTNRTEKSLQDLEAVLKKYAVDLPEETKKAAEKIIDSVKTDVETLAKSAGAAVSAPSPSSTAESGGFSGSAVDYFKTLTGQGMGGTRALGYLRGKVNLQSPEMLQQLMGQGMGATQAMDQLGMLGVGGPEETNRLLQEQNTILNDRLGGVTGG